MGGKGRVNILRSSLSNSGCSSTSISKNSDSKLPFNEAGESLGMTSLSNRTRVRLVNGKILRVGANENESAGDEQYLKIIGNGKNKSYNAPAFRPKWKPRHVVDHKGTFLHFIA